MGRPGSFLWIYEDTARGLCLIRGKNVRDVLEAAGVEGIWSVTSKGLVVPIADLPDVCAHADYLNVPYRVKQVAA